MKRPRPFPVLRSSALALVVSYSGTFAESPGAEGSFPRTARARVVHRFDFDEARLGNLEDTPMFWTAVRPADFPAFSEGRIDRSVGRSAPPSFHLSSEGRNVGYLYSGPDTRVRPGARYRVEGFIRPDRLTQARAVLGVHYLDRDGRAMLDTMVRSRYVGGGEDGEGWIAVGLALPPAPEEAHSIGLSAWVLQERHWNDTSHLRRAIETVDVGAGAWLDDITVYRLPLVRLSGSVPGNVMSAADPAELRIQLDDPDARRMTAEVVVRDVLGETVRRGTIVQESVEEGARHSFNVGGLGPGLYLASMTVTAGGGDVDTKTLTFAMLGARPFGEEPMPRSFGVVLGDAVTGNAEAELGLIRRQGVRSLKYPVWATWGEGTGESASSAGLDRFLTELNRWGVAPTAVLGGPPASFSGDERWSGNPLLEVLGSSGAGWSEDLAAVAAPYAGVFRWWQLGDDRSPLDDTGGHFAPASRALREALSRFITGPQLATTRASTTDGTGERLPVEQLTIALGRDVQTDWLESWFSEQTRAGYEQVSLYVPALPVEGYERRSRLAEWSQRVIAARHAGASVVYVPQTWTRRESAGETFTEPTEEFVLLRTIADALGDRRPGAELFVAEGVRSLAFQSGGSAVLAMWDNAAPIEGRIHALQLGGASRQVDLWGRSQSLERDEQGLHLIRLTALPTFVDRVEGWLLELNRSAALEPRWVDSGSDLVRHTLRIGGAGVPAMAGTLTIEGPASLEVSPRTTALRTMSNEAANVEVTVRYPHSEPAGKKRFVVRLTTAPDRRVIELPLFVELGLRDVEVAGTAIMEGTDLVLQQVISNRSTQVLSFRGSAAVPGRERQYRPLPNLAPGETQKVEYRFSQASELVGRQVRLMLRELNDGPRTHTLELMVQ